MSDPICVGGTWRCEKCGESYHSSGFHTCSPTPAPAQVGEDAPKTNEGAVALLDSWLAMPTVEDDGGYQEQIHQQINENSLSDREHYPSAPPAADKARDPETDAAFDDFLRADPDVQAVLRDKARAREIARKVSEITTARIGFDAEDEWLDRSTTIIVAALHATRTEAELVGAIREAETWKVFLSSTGIKCVGDDSADDWPAAIEEAIAKADRAGWERGLRQLLAVAEATRNSNDLTGQNERIDLIIGFLQARLCPKSLDLWVRRLTYGSAGGLQ